MNLILPWPPSANKVWRHVQGRGMCLSREARNFRLAVASTVLADRANKRLQGPLELEITMHPPDNRRRDLDNFAGKALLDALTKAGVWQDDSQVKAMSSRWGEAIKGGCVAVEIWPLRQEQEEN